MRVTKDGHAWRIGAAADVAWLAEGPPGTSIPTAMPQVFEAYATPHLPGRTAPARVHEQAIADTLAAHTAPQPGRLGCRHTGAHDIVLPEAPLLSLYLDWPGVLVEGGPSEAMSWRVGHMRSGDGAA